MAGPPNQRDVAKRAGVSVASVSRYVNEKGTISADVRARVEQAIRELGYSPNVVARSLKLQKSDMIGVVFPDIENLFFISLIRTIEDLASQDGYNVILCNTQNDPERERASFRDLHGRQVSAFIVIPTLSNEPERYEWSRDAKVLFLDRLSGVRDEVCIKLDNRGAVLEATAHLTALGHRRIGLVNVPRSITPGEERYYGYLDGLRAAGIAVTGELIRESGFGIDDAYHATKELLRVSPPPTAILAMSELTTVGVLRACRRQGLAVPDDISVIGFDEFAQADLLDPPLTTIEQPIDEYSEMAARALSKIIAGEYSGPRITSLRARLNLRKSCRMV